MNSIIINPKDIHKYQNCTLTYGHFSTIHAGHIRYLKYAKELGMLLVTAVLPDEKETSINNIYPFVQKERAESLAMLGLVDGIILLDKNKKALQNLVKIINPKILILGKEFQKTNDKKIVEVINFLKDRDVKTIFHAGEIVYSNSFLLQDSESDLIKKQRDKFIAVCKKQELNCQKLVNQINNWKDTRLLVIGDTIVDQYSACEAIGMSAEAPVVVVKELETKNFIGGAAIVATHIKELGAKCDFISIVGQDEIAKYVDEKLSSHGINHILIEDKTRPTIFKKRYVVENQKLFRVSRLEDHLINEDIEKKIIDQLENLASKVHGIVVSDFSYGFITPRIIKKIILLKKKYGFHVFGDLQCSSQVASITKFKDFSLLCPNEREARLSLMDKESGLETISQNLIKSTNSNRLIMKLGYNGFIAYDRDENNRIISQSFPSLSVNPVDVAGAGDSLLAVMAIGLSSNQSMMGTSSLACCMASLAVEKMGNNPIGADALKRTIKKQFGEL